MFCSTAGLAGEYVNAIAVDEDGNKWFATNNGVSLLITEETNINSASLNKSSYLNNVPNPFNSETVITYKLQNLTYITLKIYNILGQEIRTLVAKEQSPGDYQVLWDGRNNAGQIVSGGIYIYQLKAGDFVMTKKLTFLK